MTDWLTTGEAARELHVHPDTLRKRAASGQLAAVAVTSTPGGHRRYSAKDIAELARLGWDGQTARPAMSGAESARCTICSSMDPSCQWCAGQTVYLSMRTVYYQPWLLGRWSSQDAASAVIGTALVLMFMFMILGISTSEGLISAMSFDRLVLPAQVAIGVLFTALAIAGLYIISTDDTDHRHKGWYEELVQTDATGGRSLVIWRRGLASSDKP